MLMFPSLALWIWKDFHMNLSQTLSLGFGMYMLFGIVALPMGGLADRLGQCKLLVLMLLGSGLSAMACAFTTSPASLSLGLSMIGVFSAIYHPVGIGLISKCCRPRGKAMGYNGICGNLGIGMAPVLAGMFAYLYGWRMSFLVFGVIALLAGIMTAFMKIDETPVSGIDHETIQKEKAGTYLLYFVLMLVCMTLLGMCYRGTIVSIPAYFNENITLFQKLLPVGTDIQLHSARSFGVTMLVSGVYLFAMFGQLLGGSLADRMDLRAAYLLFHSLSLPAMFMMSIAGELPLFAASMVYIFFALGMQPIENSLIARLTPNRLRGIAYGLKFVLVFGVGSLSVKVVEWIMDNYELALVYRLQSGLLAAVVIIIAAIYALSRNESFRNT